MCWELLQTKAFIVQFFVTQTSMHSVPQTHVTVRYTGLLLGKTYIKLHKGGKCPRW